MRNHIVTYHLGLVAWRTGNAFFLINEATLRRAGLVLGLQVNHPDM